MSSNEGSTRGPLYDSREGWLQMFYSQHGEDRILHEHFGSAAGFFVEVGASNGIDLSNTYFFEKAGWTGVLVEANPDTAALCQTNRPRSVVFNCAAVGPESVGRTSFTVVEGNTDYSALSVDQDLIRNVGRWTGNSGVRNVQVEARTLDELLDSAPSPKINFITIDVEGHEWGVLKGFTLSRWSPEFIILERNQILPDSRIMKHLHRHGYRYVRTTGVNDWFQSARPKQIFFPIYIIRLWLSYYVPKYLRLFNLLARRAIGPIKRRLIPHTRIV